MREQPLNEVLERFTAGGADALPVIDQGTLHGVITAVDIERAIDTATDHPTAGSLLHEVPELRADQTLEDAVRVLAATEDTGLPILDQDGSEVVGWLTHRLVLSAYQAHLDTRV
jgi:CIC family chloride channel protein